MDGSVAERIDLTSSSGGRRRDSSADEGRDPRPRDPAAQGATGWGGTGALPIAEALGGYVLEGWLGCGAMGDVLAGRHRTLDRAVAVKCLPPRLASDPHVRRRFGAEARVLSSLDHPHVVPVYDYVEHEDICLLVMQALTGGTVWDRFCTAGMTMATACATALATCAGLSHAHERGVLHLDVKPDNLMFDGCGVLKITDFGIAAATDRGRAWTLHRAMVGTPAYMAPEQVDGSDVGPVTDVYAVGTLLYELLSGRLPFAADGDAAHLARRRCIEEPEPLGKIAPAVPGPVIDAVMDALARRPADRTPTAEDLGTAVGHAAVASWGTGWLEGTDVAVLAGSPLRLAATGSIVTPAPRPRPAPGVAPSSLSTPETVPPGAADPAPALHPWRSGTPDRAEESRARPRRRGLIIGSAVLHASPGAGGRAKRPRRGRWGPSTTAPPRVVAGPMTTMDPQTAMFDGPTPRIDIAVQALAAVVARARAERLRRLVGPPIPRPRPSWGRDRRVAADTVRRRLADRQP